MQLLAVVASLSEAKTEANAWIVSTAAKE